MLGGHSTVITGSLVKEVGGLGLVQCYYNTVRIKNTLCDYTFVTYTSLLCFRGGLYLGVVVHALYIRDLAVIQRWPLLRGCCTCTVH